MYFNVPRDKTSDILNEHFLYVESVQIIEHQWQKLAIIILNDICFKNIVTWTTFLRS
jgi:hypothetical protein